MYVCTAQRRAHRGPRWRLVCWWFGFSVAMLPLRQSCSEVMVMILNIRFRIVNFLITMKMEILLNFCTILFKNSRCLTIPESICSVRQLYADHTRHSCTLEGYNRIRKHVAWMVETTGPIWSTCQLLGAIRLVPFEGIMPEIISGSLMDATKSLAAGIPRGFKSRVWKQAWMVLIGSK